MSGREQGAEIEFTVDLATIELQRRAEVVNALGPHWDPIAVLEAESTAYDLLFFGLDAEQQGFYQELVEAGVLPRREAGPDAA